ncbi:MAG: hypothetical protein ACAF41_08505 [Leptolyngbya sp. BL-A-14]
MAGKKISMTDAGKPRNIALLLLASIGLVVGLSRTALADETTVAQPQQIFEDQQSRDPFSGRGNDQVGGVMDLIHRAQQAGSLSSEDFLSEQQENLNSAAAAFRAAQQKRLNSPQTAPVNEAGTTAVPKN